MRVAIVGQTLNINFQDKISGGIQTVERLHTRMLVEGHDVHFVAPGDTRIFNPDAKFWKYPTTSFETQEAWATELKQPFQKADKARLSRKHAAETADIIAEIHPDLIINHSFSSSHTRLMAELSEKYPVACFVHNTPDTAMDIGVIAKVQHYKKLTENGGSLVCVSRYQRDLWRSALKKRISSGSEHFSFLTPSDVDKIYDDVTYPIYVHVDAAPRPSLGRFIVITRPDPIKNLHKLLELCSSGVEKFPLDLFIAHPSDLNTSDYFRDKIKPALDLLLHKGWDVQLYHNADRSFLLSTLAVARGCFIPCTVEAAPVVLLEAAALGVHSIVFGKKRDGVLSHAAQDLLGDNQRLIDISGPSIEASAALQNALKTFQYTQKDREDLSEYAYQHHSFSCRGTEMVALINKLVARKPQPTSLLSFA